MKKTLSASLALALLSNFYFQLSTALAEAPAAPIIPNRTPRKVDPPKTGLEFSDHPTTEEIFRARVFEEPLVPFGGEPSAEENAALAAALLNF